MSYARLWERLLDFLNGWSTAVETEPGRLHVAVETAGGPQRVVTILMTREQWDELVTIPWGDFDSAAASVQEAVLALNDEEEFLLYGVYELVPSAVPWMPIDQEQARLSVLARQHPEGIGNWFAIDRDGVEHPFPESPPDR